MLLLSVLAVLTAMALPRASYVYAYHRAYSSNKGKGNFTLQSLLEEHFIVIIIIAVDNNIILVWCTVAILDILDLYNCAAMFVVF